MHENENRIGSKVLYSKDEIKKLFSYTNHSELKTLTNLTNSEKASTLRNNHHRSKSINPTDSPVLTELLKSNEILPYVLQFDCIKTQEGPVKKINIGNKYLDNKEKPSDKYYDYIEVSPENSKQMERMGSENSLFLALARSLLYRVYFVDETYLSHLNCLFFDEERQNFKFDSDLGLQELLRKKLCLFWLSFVNDGKFKSNCKYKNNNKLFRLYALEDLAYIVKMKIYLFGTKSTEDLNSENLKIYDPFISENGVNNSTKLNGHVFLSLNSNSNSKLRYKFLLPKSHEQNLNETLLSANNKDNFFLRTKSAYSNYMVLLPISDIKKCFSHQDLSSNINLNLFLKFLSESSVHTLLSLDDLKFDLQTNPIQLTAFLNEIWGQNHFLLDDILAEMDENNNTLKSKKNLEKESEETLFKPHDEGNAFVKNVTEHENNQIKRIRKSSISTNPSSNLFETLKSSHTDSNQVSRSLSAKISKMEIKSHDKFLNDNPSSKNNICSDSETNYNQKNSVLLYRKRSHSDNLNFHSSGQQNYNIKNQEYFLPPAFPKVKQSKLTASDLQYNPVLPPKLTSFSNNKMVFKNDCIPPFQNLRVKQGDSNNLQTDEAAKQLVKSRTRTRTLTQLNTRQSIGSCLSNLLSLTSKENNEKMTINCDNSNSSLFYNAKI